MMRYLVRVRGREVARFIYADDAQGYVQSEHARGRFREREQPLYPESDYTIEDTEVDRRVVGVNGHGNAILETLRKADRDPA